MPPPIESTFGIIRSYDIEYFPMYNSSIISIVSTMDNGTNYNITMLEKTTMYFFRVRAVTVLPGPYTPVATNTTFTAGKEALV